MEYSYKEGDRYKIFNPDLDEHNKMFTIMKVEKDNVYILFDGDVTIHRFQLGSAFENYIDSLD